MSEKDKKDLEENLTDEYSEKLSEKDETIREFNLENENPLNLSSSEMIANEDWVISDDLDEVLELDVAESVETQEEKDSAVTEEEEEKSPIFKKLADPKLPELPKENRARLQMQSPTKLYFYWSVKNNPFQTLNKAFGGNTGSYTLVVKLVNKTKNTEEIYSVEPEGNWWFNVDSDADYRAEIGFYAPNRPYFRIMFSNEIRTPRRSPSKRRDYTPYFNVNAYQFAEVLDVAGYQKDAFEVAFAGDDEVVADEATQKTYSQLTGKESETFTIGDGDEMRFVLLALASGYSLEDIKNEISQGLYNELQSEFDKLSSEEVLIAMKENFDIFTDELFEEEEIGETVFGASIVNFPRRIKKRSIPKSLSPKITEKDLKKLSKFSPVSSAEFPISSLSLKK